jgi:lipid II:glycine glycyltransferase (peptidoglycan interpeptide bridge formation enzyme)
VLKEIGRTFKRHLPAGCTFLRFDFPWSADDFEPWVGHIQGKIVKAVSDIQPPCTVILDISMNEDDILMEMKSKTRYNIRLAEKKGVIVYEAGIEELPLWYEMYRETAVRDRITIHAYEYYHSLFSGVSAYNGRPPDIKLLFARVKDEVIAGNIVAFYGEKATYLYGASRSKLRNHMPTYALQWKTIQLARVHGCTSYDLFGIPASRDPESPMHGLYRFKTGFGGRVVRRPGCWDYPSKPLLYRKFRGIERVREYYYKKLRKRL